MHCTMNTVVRKAHMEVDKDRDALAYVQRKERKLFGGRKTPIRPKTRHLAKTFMKQNICTAAKGPERHTFRKRLIFTPNRDTTIQAGT